MQQVNTRENKRGERSVSSRTAKPIRDRVQDVALVSLSLRERVGVRGYNAVRRGRNPLTRA
jgi:hypothetical protein